MLYPTLNVQAEILPIVQEVDTKSDSGKTKQDQAFMTASLMCVSVTIKRTCLAARALLRVALVDGILSSY